MRILWLVPYLPLPMFGGGTRVFNLVKVLAPTADIDMLASAEAPHKVDDMLTQLHALCRTVETVPPAVSSRRHKRRLQLRALASRHPSQYWMSYSPAMQDRINRAMRETRYDLVILEHSFSGYFAIPDGVPIVLDQHNVESSLLRRAAKSERSMIRRVYNWLEYTKFRSDEQHICRAADLILATSASDRDVLEAWRDLPPCIVVPNGVDTTYFAPFDDAPEREQPGTIVFTASMHYAPNAEAMLYFTEEIWPLIQRQMPQVTLSIVGGDPPPEIRRLGQQPNITVQGHVPDMRDHLARAQVVVVPLRIGGGTRLKIVEALAMGRAVVSTSLGCEGLEVEDGRQVLIADEPAAFAARVTELLRDPGQRAALGQEGRRLVENRYDWRAIGDRLSTTLRELLESASHPGNVALREDETLLSVPTRGDS